MFSFRSLLAIVLCMAIILGWNIIFPPQGRQNPAARPDAAVQPQAPPAPVGQAPVGQAPVGQGGPQAAAPAAPVVERPQAPEKTGRLVVADPGEERPRIEATLASRGAGIIEARLPRVERRDGKGELILIPELAEPPVALGLSIDDLKVDRQAVDPKSIPPLAKETWRLEDAAGGAQSHIFTNDWDGLAITKEVRAVTGSYHLDVLVTFENRSPHERQFHYRLWGPQALTSEALRSDGSDLRLTYGESMAADGGAVVSNIALASIKQPEWSSPNRDRVVFIGIDNNYFVSVLANADPRAETFLESGFAEMIPDPGRARELARQEYGKGWDALTAEQKKIIEEKTYKNARVGLRSRAITLAAGKTVTHRYLLYIGPRDPRVLEAYPQLNLSAINDYNFLVKLFQKILQGFHFVLFKSWGLAIMALTLFVRLCLHPINRRQQASMMRYQKKMSAVKPLLDQLKQRYGSNRVRMNQEMQKLFKEHGINPGQMMAGCLMILLQLPIWYALYNSIQYSLDLRRAPFLWIEDLTQPDRLMNLSFTIPFLGHEFNILPVVYVILTILQQKMQPKPTDPQMQQQMRMMTFMMVFFGFIFYSFPAGFLLYFITSAAIGMLESKIIKRVLAREGLTPTPPGGGASPVPAVAIPGPSRTGSGVRQPRGRKPKRR